MRALVGDERKAYSAKIFSAIIEKDNNGKKRKNGVKKVMASLSVFNAKTRHFSFQDDCGILPCTMMLSHKRVANAALYWKTRGRNLKTRAVFKENAVDILHFKKISYLLFVWLCKVLIAPVNS